MGWLFDRSQPKEEGVKWIMGDDKELLRILLKPEPFVLVYFVSVWLIAALLFGYGVYQNSYLVLLVPIGFYIAYRDYLGCYRLQLDHSVVEFRLSSQDDITITLKNKREIKVILLDKFLISNNLMLRFRAGNIVLGDGFQVTGVPFVKRKILLFTQALRVFFLQDYYQVYLSETTHDEAQFRQLLRRLNSV